MYSKSELATKIRRLVACEVPENEEDAYLAEMSRNILDPQWMSYIYHTNDYYTAEGALDIDAVCDKILSYKPIAL